MAVPLGGGKRQTIRVFVGQKRIRHDLVVRLSLWSVPSIGVIVEGDRAGQLVVYNHDARCWQIVTSVFHAIRQTWHVLTKYGKDMTLGEKQAMARAAALARDLNLTVLGYGRPKADVHELRNRTRSALSEALQKLGNPRKPSKVEAKDQLEKLASGTDALGRVNPGAFMARTIRSRESILRRLEREILQIDPQIFRRQRALVQMVLFAEQVVLFAVRDFLVRLNDSGIHGVLDRPEIRRMAIQHLRYLAGDLDRLDFAPYRDACFETAKDLCEAAEILEGGNLQHEETRRELLRLLTACESAMIAKAVQLRIERQLFVLMRDGERPEFDHVRCADTLLTVQPDLQRIRDDLLRHPVGAEPLIQLTRGVGALREGDRVSAKDALKAASAAL